MRSNTGAPFDSVVMRRREFIRDIVGPGNSGYQIRSEIYNPGLEPLFPWLSSIAQNYEQYEVLQTRFSFETTSPTTTPGSVILAFDYDSYDTAPVDKAELMQISDNIRTAPWSRCDLNLRPADLKNRGKLFTREGYANGDLKTYDLGRLMVALQGVDTEATIGELWIEYTIRLWKPQPRPQVASMKIVNGPSLNGDRPFGILPTLTGTLPITVGEFIDSRITFNQVGQFLMDFVFTGSAFSPLNGDGVDGFSSFARIASTGSLTQYAATFLVTVTEIGQAINFAIPATTLTSSVTRIAQYYSN